MKWWTLFWLRYHTLLLSNVGSECVLRRSECVLRCSDLVAQAFRPSVAVRQWFLSLPEQRWRTAEIGFLYMRWGKFRWLRITRLFIDSITYSTLSMFWSESSVSRSFQTILNGILLNSSYTCLVSFSRCHVSAYRHAWYTPCCEDELFWSI